MVFREKVVLFANPGMLNETQLCDVIKQIKAVDMQTVHKEVKENEENQAK
jgi:thioredoxin 1